MTGNLKAEQDFFAERGFGRSIGFGNNPALLVIDIVPAFTDENKPLGSNLDEQIKVINELLDQSHKKKIPVIFTTVDYDEELREAGMWKLKITGIESLKRGSEDVLVDERLNKMDSDMILGKKYASSFFGTDLSARLVSMGVDTLLITGATTSGCVRATVVDALQSGFRPMVIREGVGDRSHQANEQSLFDMNAKYADVISLGQAMKYLEEL